MILTQQKAIKTTPQQRVKNSHKRSKRLTNARQRNLWYYGEVTHLVNDLRNELSNEDLEMIDSINLSDRHAEIAKEILKEKGSELDNNKIKALLELTQYKKRLVTCGCNGLYRQMNQTNDCTLITAQTCNHRLCNICNMVRSSKLRRQWKRFLTDSERNVEISSKQLHFFENIEVSEVRRIAREVNTETGEVFKDLITDSYFTSGKEIAENFDPMHLTLTVPHVNGTWRGKKYYAREIIQQFNLLRKRQFWKENIYAGEYSIETTRDNNGLHIHIHALIFVAKFKGSRNFLSEQILRHWNKLTVDPGNKISKTLTADRIDGIKKSFAFLSENELNNLVLDLNARGATMVGLKSLFYEIKASDVSKYSNKGVFKQGDKYFKYCTARYPESILKGVVECLKYHFEPAALEDNGILDKDLLVDILPNIYRQRLYGKFGGFYRVSQLNVVEDPVTDSDMLDEMQEYAQEAFNPSTGEKIDITEYHYAIADTKSVSFHESKPITYLARNKIKKIITPKKAPTLGRAIEWLSHYGYRCSNN